MKLEKIGYILETQNLAIFERSYLKPYKQLFILGLDWLCKCRPGTAAVDIRLEESFKTSDSDIRFFTTDDEKTFANSIIGLTNKDKIFSLEESFFNKKIFFIVKNLNHILGDCRLSFDWCSSAQMRVSLDEYNPEAILDGLLNDHRLPFKRKDRFYMFPIIQIKRDT